MNVMFLIKHVFECTPFKLYMVVMYRLVYYSFIHSFIHSLIRYVCKCIIYSIAYIIQNLNFFFHISHCTWSLSQKKFIPIIKSYRYNFCKLCNSKWNVEMSDTVYICLLHIKLPLCDIHLPISKNKTCDRHISVWDILNNRGKI